MQAALLPTTAMSVPSQFQQHHPQHQLQQLQQQHNKSKTSDRVEVSSLRSNYHHFGILLSRELQIFLSLLLLLVLNLKLLLKNMEHLKLLKLLKT